MIDPKVAALVERNMRGASIGRRTRPADMCPRHQRPLEGGPVWFHCPVGHAVPAADIDHEYHPPGGSR